MPKITLGKGRQTTTYTVSFPTVPSIKLQPIKVDLHEEKYHHDMLVLQFSTVMPLWIKTLKTGTPVSFSFSQDSFSRSWSGYVSNIATHTIGQTQELMEVTCVGPTYVLKDRQTRVFNNSTIAGAVESIVSGYGFKFIGDDNGVVFDQLIIAGHSYWEWIVEQAKKLGYGILVDGMAFYFRPLDKLISAGVTNVPSFVMMGKGAPINSLQEDRTLDWMRVVSGENNEIAGAIRSTKNVSGVDPYSTSVASYTANPKDVGIPLRANVSDVLFNQINQEHVASNASSARAISEGFAHHARFNVIAKLKGQGDPRIRLHNPVAVLGTSDNTDGLWVVHKVIHHFTSNLNYQVDLDLVTDGTGEVSSRYASTAQNSISGVVNLDEALSNGGLNPNASQANQKKLKVQAPFHSELTQGWNRAPSRWAYSPSKAGK